MNIVVLNDYKVNKHLYAIMAVDDIMQLQLAAKRYETNRWLGMTRFQLTKLKMMASSTGCSKVYNFSPHSTHPENI